MGAAAQKSFNEVISLATIMEHRISKEIKAKLIRLSMGRPRLTKANILFIRIQMKGPCLTTTTKRWTFSETSESSTAATKRSDQCLNTTITNKKAILVTKFRIITPTMALLPFRWNSIITKS